MPRFAEPDEVSPARPYDPPWRSRTAHRSLDPRVSEILARRRAELGWNRSEASRRTGVSRRMLLALERGERRPSVSLAEAVIDGYRLNGQPADTVRAAGLRFVGRDSPFRSGAYGDYGTRPGRRRHGSGRRPAA